VNECKPLSLGRHETMPVNGPGGGGGGGGGNGCFGYRGQHHRSFGAESTDDLSASQVMQTAGGVLRTSTQPTLNRGGIEKKHSTDVE